MSVTPSAVAAAVDAVRTEAAPAAEGAATVDATTATTAPAKNPHLDEYARKERAMRAKERDWQAKQTEMAAKLAKYETEYIPKSKFSDPTSALDTLSELGLSYDKLTELLMNAPNSQDPTIRQIRAEVKALKDQQAKAAEEAQNATKTQYEAAIQSITTEVGLMVEGNADYEMIASNGMQSAVVELIEQTFNTEGKLMDIADAAKQVENYLVDEAIRLSSLPKVQNRLKPQPPVEPESRVPVTPKPQGISTQLKTLTNKLETQPAKRTSEAERRARAIAAFAGKQG